MDTWLTHIDEHRTAVLLLVVLACTALAAAQWVSWMFALGRFNSTRPSATKSGQGERPLRYILALFFVQIVNDFRHLLALLLLSLFALVLVVAMWPGLKNDQLKEMTEGLQAVAAALGGLIGSIVGYYFGESAAKGRAPGGEASPPTPAPVQGGPAVTAPAGSSPIRPAPPPPTRGSPAGQPAPGQPVPQGAQPVPQGSPPAP